MHAILWQTYFFWSRHQTRLGDLHEGAILYNIRQRFEKNMVYCYIGSILSAANPYIRFPEVYSNDVIKQYKGKNIGELPPHVFAIANEAYENMWKNTCNQVILISGESGAGKTETTKFMLRFLSFLSNEKQSEIGKVGICTRCHALLHRAICPCAGRLRLGSSQCSGCQRPPHLLLDDTVLSVHVSPCSACRAGRNHTLTLDAFLCLLTVTRARPAVWWEDVRRPDSAVLPRARSHG
jgi:hypothetical protein